MPRTYKRKTDRVSTPLEELERAVKEVQQGKTIRQVGKEMKICRMTIKRHMDKKKIGEVTKPGYERTAVAKRVFNENMEKELADHIKTLAAMFHGIGVMKCRELAFEFAQRNSIDMPASWTRDEKAGPDWFNAFKARYHLACRVPEATSLGRATAFNKHNVGEFFDNLSKVKDRYSFPPHMMYNMDETGVTTVQTPKQVVTEKGKKQVGSVTSAERGELVTVACAVNATGNAVPPMFIFPHVRFKDSLLNGSPAGSIGHCTKSGWMNEDAFLIFLKHFIRHTNCSTDHPVLLILDNHESHISLKDIFPEEDYAPSMVTDRANPEDEPSATADLPGEEPSTSAAAHLPGEEPSTSAAAHLPGPSHEPTHVTADPDPGEPPATLTNPEHLSSDKSGSSAHLGYVSPEVILPLPKATERKKKCVRKKVKTRIVTDTPEKMELEKAHKEKEDKKAEQEKKKNEREKKRALKAANQTKTKKKTAVYSSSEESSTTNDEAEDGLEKTHSREKERAEKKKRSGNKKGALKGSKPTKPKRKCSPVAQKRVTFRFHLAIPLIMRVQMSRVMMMMVTRICLLVTLSL
ncbi:uncharacterized protein LOC117549854 [Gymnodraco acuticeps]|uniref:Uncharacterized protein LOC117549854 n=1 Tax=Gymnodraco acuticeps TaxID=8218 RepID=A0A6P8VNG3_GYMAC|nr:uncharacterized protein LOC117549854 [Gymnodraco acuticeps]